jgi:hypothetical protein
MSDKERDKKYPENNYLGIRKPAIQRIYPVRGTKIFRMGKG